ncbi:MAG: YceI family protein [Chitinophagaceae bacterium]
MKSFLILIPGILLVSAIRAQSYQPDDSRSSVKFTIKDFGITTTGSIKGVAGTIEFDSTSPEKAVFNLKADVSTVNTSNDLRDTHLKKPEYFDVEKYPTITFASKTISGKSSNLQVSGELTIKATTKSVTIPVQVSLVSGGYQFKGSFDLNRRDYDVGGSSLVLGDNVTVTFIVIGINK